MMMMMMMMMLMIDDDGDDNDGDDESGNCPHSPSSTDLTILLTSRFWFWSMIPSSWRTQEAFPSLACIFAVSAFNFSVNRSPSSNTSSAARFCFWCMNVFIICSIISYLLFVFILLSMFPNGDDLK